MRTFAVDGPFSENKPGCCIHNLLAVALAVIGGGGRGVASGRGVDCPSADTSRSDGFLAGVVCLVAYGHVAAGTCLLFHGLPARSVDGYFFAVVEER